MNTSPDPAKSPLEVAFELLGPNKIARICGVKGPSACKWRSKGMLPRTEWTGETNYASLIAEATGGAVTKEQLLVRGNG
ncbi:MAG: helix-turn-helix domain-containing protein [Burkholderiaceae bacterium]|nr:helix-turn-helix domain-containing protein [Burkholderiaceae bacterium]